MVIVVRNMLQLLKKRIQQYRDNKKTVEAEMEAAINKRIVKSSIQQVEEICEEKGLLLAIAIYPDVDGTPTCTYSFTGVLSTPNLELVEHVADKVDLPLLAKKINNILHPPLKPVLPSNESEYNAMVADMVRQVQEGMIPDNTKDLIKQMLIKDDVKGVDCVLDQYNRLRNGRQPLGG